MLTASEMYGWLAAILGTSLLHLRALSMLSMLGTLST